MLGLFSILRQSFPCIIIIFVIFQVFGALEFWINHYACAIDFEPFLVAGLLLAMKLIA
jgi:hypothetical protein